MQSLESEDIWTRLSFKHTIAYSDTVTVSLFGNTLLESAEIVRLQWVYLSGRDVFSPFDMQQSEDVVSVGFNMLEPRCHSTLLVAEVQNPQRKEKQAGCSAPVQG